tara:strand:+ start:1294 stop:2082 length:789 start_codon:yes stop_codon:yes gene_type:complete
MRVKLSERCKDKHSIYNTTMNDNKYYHAIFDNVNYIFATKLDIEQFDEMLSNTFDSVKYYEISFPTYHVLMDNNSIITKFDIDDMVNDDNTIKNKLLDIKLQDVYDKSNMSNLFGNLCSNNVYDKFIKNMEDHCSSYCLPECYKIDIYETDIDAYEYCESYDLFELHTKFQIIDNTTKIKYDIHYRHKFGKDQDDNISFAEYDCYPLRHGDKPTYYTYKIDQSEYINGGENESGIDHDSKIEEFLQYIDEAIRVFYGDRAMF